MCGRGVSVSVGEEEGEAENENKDLLIFADFDVTETYFAVEWQTRHTSCKQALQKRQYVRSGIRCGAEKRPSTLRCYVSTASDVLVM